MFSRPILRTAKQRFHMGLYNKPVVCCLTRWRAGHCRFPDLRDVRMKSEVQQRCDDRKSQTNDQRQLFTSPWVQASLPQIYRLIRLKSVRRQINGHYDMCDEHVSCEHTWNRGLKCCVQRTPAPYYTVHEDQWQIQGLPVGCMASRGARA